MARYAKIQDIVRRLVEDLNMLHQWRRLGDLLDLEAASAEKWNLGLSNSTLDYPAVFTEMLQSWISRNPNQTVGDLCHRLREMWCVAIAEFLIVFEKENLEDSFGLDSLICIKVPSKKHKKGKQQKVTLVIKGAKIEPNSKTFVLSISVICFVTVIVLIPVVISVLIPYSPAKNGNSNDASLSSGGKTNLGEFITQNLSELIGGTNVDLSLLNFYVQKGVISSDFKDVIEAKETNQKKADALYGYLKRISETKLELIKQGLKISLNEKALEVFKKLQ